MYDILRNQVQFLEYYCELTRVLSVPKLVEAKVAKQLITRLNLAFSLKVSFC